MDSQEELKTKGGKLESKKMRTKRSNLGLMALAATLSILLVSSFAAAEEVTRDTYKAQVEPICKTNTKANKKILRGVRKLVKRGKLKSAGFKFLRAAAALRKTYRQLAAVPKPPADTARLTKWLRSIKTEASLFQSAGRALKTGKRSKAAHLVAKLEHNATKTNNRVLAFEFRYCRFEPSRFT